jgi:AAA domain
MTFIIRKAERKQAKLRIGVSGASGSGKTYSALLLARGLVDAWDKVGLIDTENGSGELYSHLGDYNVITLEAPFSPERYREAIKSFQEAGIEALVIDSVSHEWEGSGGCLDLVDKLGGKYQDWGKVTPRHNQFVQEILQSDMHVITTTRRKQDYEMTKGNDGKVKVEKMGLKEVQRDGFEYELTLALNIDTRHFASASKDRTGLYMDKPEFVITEKTGEELRAWASSGKVVDPAVKEKKKVIMEHLKALGYTIKTADDAKTSVMEVTGIELAEDNFDAIIKGLSDKIEDGKKTPPATTPEAPAENTETTPEVKKVAPKASQTKLDEALKK